MLETVLAIAGKPGLYRLVSRGNKNLIVESLDAAKKRTPVFGTDKVISLGDIAMYTEGGEVALKKVLQSLGEKENFQKASIDAKKASKDELSAYFAEILPEYDRDRVYITDIKKLISWYNILIQAGITEFDHESDAEGAAVEKEETVG